MCCVTLLRVTASSPSRRTTLRSTGSLGPSALCWTRLTVATDAVSSSQATPPRSAPFERTPAASLTQRASLNVAASLLDYAAKVAPTLHPAIRATCALLVVALLFANLASLPESVLRGMNLGYKRMGLQALLEVVGGALTAGAVYVGLGIAGAAGSQIVFYALLGLCFWFVSKKYVRWFGVERPTRAEVRELLGLSVWYSAGEAITKLLLASDAVILGIVVSPAAVTSYVLTGYATRLAVNVHVLAAGGAIPGIGGVIGEQQYDKATRLRRELLALTWLFVTVVGATVLLWNHSLLGLWVGAENYAGTPINLLIVLIMAQTAFIRSDAFVIDAALRPRLRVAVTAAAAALTIGLSTLLTMRFGMVGV